MTLILSSEIINFHGDSTYIRYVSSSVQVFRTTRERDGRRSDVAHRHFRDERGRSSRSISFVVHREWGIASSHGSWLETKAKINPGRTNNAHFLGSIAIHLSISLSLSIFLFFAWIVLLQQCPPTKPMIAKIRSKQVHTAFAHWTLIFMYLQWISWADKQDSYIRKRFISAIFCIMVKGGKATYP